MPQTNEKRRIIYLKKRIAKDKLLEEELSKGIKVSREFGNWFAGFVDGEGCFSINHNGRDRRWMSVRFYIGLRADDKAILEYIQKTLGFGKIFYYDRTSKTRNQKPQYRFEVESKRLCFKLLSIFDRFKLRTKKHRDYKIWRKAVLMMGVSRAHNTYDPSEIQKLKNQLSHVRTYKEVI